MKRVRTPLLAAALMIALPAAGGAQVTIGPMPDPGGPATAEQRIFFSSQNFVGQTFTVPTNASVLTNFTLRMSPQYGKPIFFMALAAWDPSALNTVGPNVYSTGAIPGDAPEDLPHRSVYEIPIGPLWLSPGAMYLAFLGIVPWAEDAIFSIHTVDYTGPLASPEGSVYEGGQLVTGRRLEPFGPIRWEVSPVGGDAQFTATFAETTVPEPATVALLGTGLAALAGWRRRRRGVRDGA